MNCAYLSVTSIGRFCLRENIIQAEQILLLNGFMKKSTKDYKKEIQKAQHILDTYYEKED